jgi:hypothetical protein
MASIKTSLLQRIYCSLSAEYIQGCIRSRQADNKTCKLMELTEAG